MKNEITMSEINTCSTWNRKDDSPRGCKTVSASEIKPGDRVVYNNRFTLVVEDPRPVQEVKNFTPREDIKASDRDRTAKHIRKGFKAVCAADGRLYELVDLRIGQTDTTAYACVWLHRYSGGAYAYGSGRAGGYGYDRSSAAAEAAFRAAGVTMTEGFGGAGDQMTREAVFALGRYLAPGLEDQIHVVEFYG